MPPLYQKLSGFHYLLTVKPDVEIFGEREYSFDLLSQRLRELAFLNPGLHISIEDERDVVGRDTLA